MEQVWAKAGSEQSPAEFCFISSVGWSCLMFRVPLLPFFSHWSPEFQRPAAPTVQPKDILEVGEDFPLVTGAEDALPGDPLVEDVVQDLQGAHMGSLCVEQLWGNRRSRIAAVEPEISSEQAPPAAFPSLVHIPGSAVIPCWNCL